MKKLFTLLLFSLLIGSLKAQDNLDSLMNVWNDETMVDTIRLKAIETFLRGGEHREFLPNEYLFTNPDSAFVLIESMSELSKATENKKYELLALGLKGHYLQISGDNPEAIKKFEECLEMARVMEDKRLIIMSIIRLAFGESTWGSLIRSDSSKTVLAKAENHFREALNLIELESFGINKVPVSPDHGLLSYEAHALFGLGANNYYQANYPTAIEYSEKSLVVSEKSDDKFVIISAYMLIGFAYIAQENYPMARKYLEQQIELAGQYGNDQMLESGMGNLGWVLQTERNFPAAIKYFTKSLELAEQTVNKHWIGHNLQSLGDLYTEVGELSKAEDYLIRALTAMQEAGHVHRSEQLGMFIGLHTIYVKQKAYSKALENDSIYLVLAEELNPSLVPRGLEMLSEDYYELGDYTKALEYGFNGLKTHEVIGLDLYNTLEIRIKLFLLIGKTYNKQGLFAKAVTWCEKANTESIELQKDACECLYESHKALNHGNEALAYHEKFLFLSDSLNTEELAKNLQQMEFTKQVLTDSISQVEKDRLVQEAHQEEVRANEKQRNILLGSGLFVLFFAGGLWSRLRYIRRSKATLQVEKDRSENLLLNILPAEIAEELKANGKAEARDFELVSILFTDFKEFTQTSEKLSAAELVGEINHCFEGFDAIMEKHGVEKIKTIGDAYMAAGGLPVSTPESTLHTVQAALEMCEFVANRKSEREAEGKIGFEMRCGIHTGPVVAGIVGVKKFQYDIWGDTVNTASRMESNSEVGQVNISQDTYELIKSENSFSFEKRAKIEVKGKGEMEMYFVSI